MANDLNCTIMYMYMQPGGNKTHSHRKATNTRLMLIAPFPSTKDLHPMDNCELYTHLCSRSDLQSLVLQHGRICRSDCSWWIENYTSCHPVKIIFAREWGRKMFNLNNLNTSSRTCSRCRESHFLHWGFNCCRLKSYLGVNPACTCWFHWRP
jgi:hypothetical protein